MLGKIIGVLCFILAGIYLLLHANITAFQVLFILGAFFWMIGVCQRSLEKIEYFSEWQKNLLGQQREQNKRIIYLLEKAAGEIHDTQEDQLQEPEQSNVTPQGRS